jgi:5-methylcytosine-specific restriction protein A
VTKLRSFPAKVRPFGGKLKPVPKSVDPFYLTPEYARWREQVIARAGGRCEAIEDCRTASPNCRTAPYRGSRCSKAAPFHRMFADHIKERRDGGDPLDPNNGECLCGRHHTLKTARARAERRRGQGG